MVHLVLSNIQYSLLKKQSENPTTATTKHPQTSSKPSPILIWNQNNKLPSPDLPVPSLPVLPTDLPLLLPLPFRFYPLSNYFHGYMTSLKYFNLQHISLVIIHTH